MLVMKLSRIPGSECNARFSGQCLFYAVKLPTSELRARRTGPDMLQMERDPSAPFILLILHIDMAASPVVPIVHIVASERRCRLELLVCVHSSGMSSLIRTEWVTEGWHGKFLV